MRWVDTHCHLQLDGRDPVELLDRATEVEWVVVPGIDLESSEAARMLAEAHPNRILASAGLHPHDSASWSGQANGIAELAPGAAAIGETGLDFYRNLSPREDQIISFREQIALAMDLSKPLIVHCRDAFADTFGIIEETGAGPQTILHCWTGGTRWTRRFLELGVTFSFAGPVAFETGETIRLGAELVPPERALVETDAPFLAPPPHRGEQNEPGWVRHNGAALAEVWGMEVSDVAETTSENARRVFGR
jgi:TatD DNase family protein